MKSVYCCGIGCIVNLMRSLYWEFEYIFSLRFCLFENIAIFLSDSMGLCKEFRETRCRRSLYRDLVYKQCVYVHPFYVAQRNGCMRII